jgi:hypothetical protein
MTICDENVRRINIHILKVIIIILLNVIICDIIHLIPSYKVDMKIYSPKLKESRVYPDPGHGQSEKMTVYLL